MVRRAVCADLALLCVACTWGATFPVVKAALDDASPVLFLAVRFALASLFVIPLWPVLRPRPRARELAAGGVLGALLAVPFTLQTVALQEIGAARSAFLTSLYVLLVPLFAVVFTRRAPSASTWRGLALVLIGLLAMTWDGVGLGWRAGDLLTVGCAVGFALHIVGVGALTVRYDYRRLFVLQILVATVLLSGAVALEPVRWTFSPRLIGALLATAGLATALAFYVQNRVQRHTSASRAAIIFAMEPVFAALAAVGLSGGQVGLSTREMGGAALILGGMLASELGPRRSALRAEPEAPAPS